MSGQGDPRDAHNAADAPTEAVAYDPFADGEHATEAVAFDPFALDDDDGDGDGAYQDLDSLDGLDDMDDMALLLKDLDALREGSRKEDTLTRARREALDTFRELRGAKRAARPVADGMVSCRGSRRRRRRTP